MSGQPPERIRTRLKLLISWLIIALGCLVGLLACVGLGFVPVYNLSEDRHLNAWLGILGIALLALTFLIGSLIALQHRRLAGIIFLSVMPVWTFCLKRAGSEDLTWAGLVAWSAPPLLVGLFWLGTGSLGWPALVQVRSWSRRKRASALAATCVTVLFLDVALTLLLSGLFTSLFHGDCGYKPPFLHPLSPTQAVFTARVVFAARSLNELMDADSTLRRPGPDRNVGDWAIGIVEERFWGMPLWTRFVLLTNHAYWDGETYFIDGLRYAGLLTQFLPIVEGGEGSDGCSRTKPIQDSVVDLRLLRRPPVGTRVIGYVRGPEEFATVNARPRKPVFVAGAKIEVTGPAWASSITTDSEGVYELDGLAPGDYTLWLPTPETQTVGFFQDRSRVVIHVDNGGVVERNFQLFWDGRIQGTVFDNSGTPARAQVKLVSADDRHIPGYVHNREGTAKDGSYQFRRVPPGRYLVVMNPDGPDNERPHNIQYYPDAVRKENAQVIELAGGQRLGGISFRTIPLSSRDSEVRITRPDGTAVAGAYACVAYDKTNAYEARNRGHCIEDADQDGVIAIRTYGGSQVRIFARECVHRPGSSPPDCFYSKPIDYAADQIPNTVNLILNVVKP